MPLVKVRHHTETERRWTRGYVGLAWLAELGNGVIQTITGLGHILSVDVLFQNILSKVLAVSTCCVYMHIAHTSVSNQG